MRMWKKNPLICPVYDFNIYNGNMWVLKKDKAALQNTTELMLLYIATW